MSERPFMQLYVSDFVGDTLHLSTEQIGAYMLLLMAMWNAGGRLPDDDAKLARVVRLSVKKWRAIAPDLMAFLERKEGEIWHNRLTKELQKSAAKSERRAASGKQGATAKALKYREVGLANASRLLKHSPDTIKKEKEKSPHIQSKPVANATQFEDRVRVHKDDPIFAEIAAMRGVPIHSLQVSERDGFWPFPVTEVEQARQRLEARAGPEMLKAANDLGTGLERMN